MFTRSSSAEQTAHEPPQSKPNGVRNGPYTAPAAQQLEKSIIGNDLKIVGQGLKIICRGILQVDGEIQGDVQGAEVIVGERGQVTGMVAGQQVIVRGKVSGVICGKSISLQSTSQVDGDVHHLSIAIESGAVFEGRSRRAGGEADLNAAIEARVGQA